MKVLILLNSHFFGKAAYAFLFVVFIPTLLLKLAASVDQWFPQYDYSKWQIFFILTSGAGLFLILHSMYLLLKVGRGLPMNAYPTKEYVAVGAYRYFRNPIYLGFVLLLIGYFGVVQSSGGLFWVVPLIFLGCNSIYYGYEIHELRKKFPSFEQNKTLTMAPLGHFLLEPLLKWMIPYAEKIANFWKELHLGKLRIISHSIFVFAAAFIGSLFLFSSLASPLKFISILICVGIIVSSLLWAIFLEGTHKVSRPFGYYGGILGATILIGVSIFFSSKIFWALASSFCIAACLFQGLGRFRCLVHGCCHGRPTRHNNFGIRYYSEESRVCKFSKLRGESLYPTQLLSMASNLLLFFFLLLFVKLKAPASFVVGSYLLVSSLFRFIEEAYRGEAQTKFFKGLSVYQWISIFLVFIGILICLLRSSPVNDHFSLSLKDFVFAFALGIIATLFYSVDFPKSTFKYSRLT